jgi:octanoyl-[GcvH]:protein N-octanoyltransferase
MHTAARLPDSPYISLGRWRIFDDDEPGGIEAGVARDIVLGSEVAQGAPATMRIWQSIQALVVSRQDASSPNYAHAKQVLEREGWPVITRTTGGSAVPQGLGSLQFSMLLPRSRALAYSLEDIYRLLCHPLQLALGQMGIDAKLGSVPDAFCDGRFNLVAGGRKIAGTAQVWRADVARYPNHREGYALAHASLFVDVNKRSATEMVNRFYQLLGSKSEFREEAVVTVRECLNRDAVGEHYHPEHGLVQDMRRLLVDVCKQLVVGC